MRCLVKALFKCEPSMPRRSRNLEKREAFGAFITVSAYPHSPVIFSGLPKPKEKERASLLSSFRFELEITFWVIVAIRLRKESSMLLEVEVM